MSELIYGLIGRNLGHSFSVPIHAQLGNPSYKLYELEPEALSPFLQRHDIGGLNVTIPYKCDVIPLCHSLSPEAQAIGSVNTLVRSPSGLIGHNTDYAGFEYMAELAGITFTGKKVVVFGNGGVCKTVQAVAKRHGARELIVVSRSGENNYDNLSRHYDADILVNATPLGTYPKPGPMAADPSLFPRCQGVLDMVYNPRRTAFIMRAEELHIPCSGGLPMLVAQATAAEELFFNKSIDPGENLRILKKLRRDSGNIILIGMPGSGKSSIGRALSSKTGRRAYDVDEEIERSQGMAVSDIFSRFGEERFRELERECTSRLGMESGIIIMTGGGVVLDRRNYPSLHQNGRIYRVNRLLSLLPTEGRPLSQGADLRQMLAIREPLYQAFSDVEIENNGELSQSVDAIWRDYCENSCD